MTHVNVVCRLSVSSAEMLAQNLFECRLFRNLRSTMTSVKLVEAAAPLITASCFLP